QRPAPPPPYPPPLHDALPISPKLRAQIFGLNAARPYGIDIGEVLRRAGRDDVERRRGEYQSNPDPHFLTFGPRNRREFLANLKADRKSTRLNSTHRTISYAVF